MWPINSCFCSVDTVIFERGGGGGGVGIGGKYTNKQVCVRDWIVKDVSCYSKNNSSPKNKFCNLFQGRGAIVFIFIT